MRLIQVTLGSGATQITPNLDASTGKNIYASALIIQNNAANACRVGDNTVTTSRGIALPPGSPGGSSTITFTMTRGSLLSQWYIAGTSGNVIDVLYETAQ